MRRGLIVIASLLGACDPLADGDYVGDPMFTLQGTLVTTTKQSSTAGGVLIAWQDPGGAGGPGVATTPVSVETELPATVKLSVPLPPPPVVRFAFDDSDVELAEGFIVLVDETAGPRPVSQGIARDRVVVFATADVAEGTQAADYLGGPITAGYHLRRLVQAGPSAAAAPHVSAAQQLMIDRCVASGASLAACTARRSYQLAAVDDTDLVRIVVRP
ncbi:MAG TPA: hypothetical protein VMZ53_02745 [Kofleriaceae bacterium]|nr:hypothetical protein [Kofleriaceae bacterium]